MILFHGSYTIVENPDLLHSRDDIDFGRAFYTTPIREQALSWCNRFKKEGKDAFLSKYLLDEEAVETLRVLRFESYSDDWLDFVTSCRKGLDDTDFDIVIGGVANDRVFNTVELYFDNLIDKKEAIKRLRYEEPNSQIACRTEEALKLLEFKGFEKL